MLKKTPFMEQSTAPQVWAAQGGDPYDNTIQALSELELSALKGKNVLLKPNAGRVAHPCSGITTHPDVVAAAIDVFRQAGARVAIGESPITGVKTMDAFEATGIAAVAQRRACPLIDMDQRDPVVVPLEQGIALKELQVCADVFDFDLVVSLPVMKTHMHTGVTLSVKNMKGCLWRRSKVQLHMLPPVPGSDHKPINIAIADMMAVLRPHLSIIDGSIGLEGLGPSAGEPRELGVIVVGTDAFAADAVACQLMGMHAADVPHLSLGAARGFGEIQLDRIQVAPESWRQWAQPFAPPPENLTLAFPDVTVLDNNSCSACQSTLMLFLKQHRQQLFDYFPKEIPVRVAIGKGHTDLPEKTLCLGNCTARQKHRGVFVPGCPPVASEILNALTGQPTVSHPTRKGPQKAAEDSL